MLTNRNIFSARTGWHIIKRRFSIAQKCPESNVLVLNCGSSSIKFQVLNPEKDSFQLSGQVDRLNSSGEAKLKFIWKDKEEISEDLGNVNYKNVVDRILDIASQRKIDFVGHRVVHGGELFRDATEITEESFEDLRRTEELAPLHNPVQINVIKQTIERFPDTRQVAVFDTSYHAKILPHVYRYAVPSAWYHQHGVRRFGFHGTSHDYVVRRAASLLGERARVVSCHLGAGCSLAASVTGEAGARDTSMGFSPLSGLMMGTRSGDCDPGLVTHMADRLGVSATEVITRLNRESGFLGVAGTSDSRDLEERFIAGDKEAALAIEMFCYQVAKTLASYIVPLGGLDAVVFTGGIGEKSFIKRAKIIDHLKPFGVGFDPDHNGDNGKKSGGVISSEASKVKVFVIKTNEEKMIADKVLDLFGKI